MKFIAYSFNTFFSFLLTVILYLYQFNSILDYEKFENQKGLFLKKLFNLHIFFADHHDLRLYVKKTLPSTLTTNSQKLQIIFSKN